MEVVEIHHVPAGPNNPAVTTLTNRPPDRQAKIHREIQSDLHEFKRRLPREQHINCGWLSCLKRVPTWLWLLGLGLLIWAAICFFISVMVVYFYGYQESIRPIYPTGQVPGEPCSSTSQCIDNAYCVRNSSSYTGSCQCATDYYYDSTAFPVQCTQAGSNGAGGCTDSSMCITSVGLVCSNGNCQCPTTHFFNMTSNRCEYLKVSPKKQL